MITLTYDTTTIELDPDLRWTDEGQWQAVEQSAVRTVTGALVVSTATRAAGRPITLQPDDDSSAWMSRSTIDTLEAWANAAGRSFVLSLHGVSRNVIFRHQDGAGIEYSPVVHYSDVQSGDWYRATFRFMEI